MDEPSEREKHQREERTLSRPLHNFTLPTRLKWGKQRPLRCMNHLHPTFGGPAADRRLRGSKLPVSRRSPIGSFQTDKDKELCPIGSGANPASHRRSSPIAPPSAPKKEKELTSRMSGGGGSEIEAVRQKLVSDLQVEADRLKQNVLDHENDQTKAVPSEEELNAGNRPWNLRSRRGGGGGSGNNNSGGINGGLSMEDEGWRSGEGGSSGMQRPKFSFTLTKEEIEADFLAMTGAKPPRRPKRRPKAVQKQIDGLFPGSWLREVTPDAYKVPDNGEQGNK